MNDTSESEDAGIQKRLPEQMPGNWRQAIVTGPNSTLQERQLESQLDVLSVVVFIIGVYSALLLGPLVICTLIGLQVNRPVPQQDLDLPIDGEKYHAQADYIQYEQQTVAVYTINLLDVLLACCTILGLCMKSIRLRRWCYNLMFVAVMIDIMLLMTLAILLALTYDNTNEVILVCGPVYCGAFGLLLTPVLYWNGLR
jgi:hypothetical protein